MNKLFETLGIYESMLDMSICRGDLPSAKLAYRAICFLARNPREVLRAILLRASLAHFSILPTEILELSDKKAWMTISAMCMADLDKRALSMAYILMKNPSSHNVLVSNLVRWNKTNSIYPKSILTYLDRLLYQSVASMNRVIKDDSYFHFSGVPLEEVNTISVINPIYYIGNKSWMRNIIDSSLNLIVGPAYKNKAVDMLNIFEINHTDKMIQYELDYWKELKNIIFDGEDSAIKAETKWINSVRPQVVSLVTELLEIRLPIQERG